MGSAHDSMKKRRRQLWRAVGSLSPSLVFRFHMLPENQVSGMALASSVLWAEGRGASRDGELLILFMASSSVFSRRYGAELEDETDHRLLGKAALPPASSESASMGLCRPTCGGLR